MQVLDNVCENQSIEVLIGKGKYPLIEVYLLERIEIRNFR